MTLKGKKKTKKLQNMPSVKTQVPGHLLSPCSSVTTDRYNAAVAPWESVDIGVNSSPAFVFLWRLNFFSKRTINSVDAMKWLNKTCQQGSWALGEKGWLESCQTGRKMCCMSISRCLSATTCTLKERACWSHWMECNVCTFSRKHCFKFSYFNLT